MAILAFAGCGGAQDDLGLVARFDGGSARGEILLRRTGAAHALEVRLEGLPEGRLALRLHDGSTCRVRKGATNGVPLAAIDVPADGAVSVDAPIPRFDGRRPAAGSVGLHDAEGRLVGCAPLGPQADG